MFDELYQARLIFDTHRQPSHHSSFLELHALLDDLSLSHPYSLSKERRRRFANVLNGPKPVDLKVDFIYRLASLTKLIERDGIKRRPDRAASAEELFQEALAEFEALHTPVPLTWVANGQVVGSRSIDFWTDLELHSGDLERNCYRIGMPRDWFPVDDPIVLICPTRLFDERACKLRVPTILDGYDFGPFFSTAEADHLGRGHTLDLHDPTNFKPGVSEFVSGDLPAEYLAFIPMEWTPRPAFSRERSFQANSPLIPRLIEFFRGAI